MNKILKAQGQPACIPISRNHLMELVHKHQRTNHTVPALELRQIRWRRKEEEVEEGDEEREGRETAKKVKEVHKGRGGNPNSTIK